MEKDNNKTLKEQAAELARLHPHVETELPPVIEETGDMIKDVMAHFGFDFSDESSIANLLTPAQQRIAIEIAHNLGRGLTPDGKKTWLFGRLKIENLDSSLAQALAESEKYKYSPGA